MQEVQTGSYENGFTDIINAEKWVGNNFAAKGSYNLFMALKNTSDK